MSTSSQSAIVPPAGGPLPSISLDRKLCDAALAAYSALSPDDWRGFHPFPGAKIVFPDPALARQYLAAATHAAQVNRDPVGAIRLLDASIRLDYVGALNDGESLIQRMHAYEALGRDEPRRSILLYHLGITFSRLKLWAEAGAVYRAAAELDPLFGWHFNNFAWMAATAIDPQAHSGPLAVALAERACAVSGWGFWCFLGTLAAAHARTGDFRRAVAWQRIALHLAPRGERHEEATRLCAFEAGKAFVDHAPKPVGGYDTSETELTQLDVRELLQEAEDLIGSSRTTVH